MGNHEECPFCDWNSRAADRAVCRRFGVSCDPSFAPCAVDGITFRAKNAAIPIIYYIYYHGLAGSIVKATYDAEDRENIAKWLSLTFIKSIFGGQSDSALVTMRKVLKDTKSTKFPAQELMDAFKNDPARNYSFDDEFLEGLLEAQKDSNDAF